MLPGCVKKNSYSNYSDKYRQQESNLRYRKRGHIPPCGYQHVFLFSSSSLYYIPFPCVGLDGEIAGEWLTKTWPRSEVVIGGRLE